MIHTFRQPCLIDYIVALEEALGLTANKILMPMQPGDVPATATTALQIWTGFKFNTPGARRRGPLRGLVTRLLQGLTGPIALGTPYSGASLARPHSHFFHCRQNPTLSDLPALGIC